MKILTSTFPVKLDNNVFTCNVDENFEFVLKDDYEEIVNEVKACDIETNLYKYSIDSDRDDVRSLIESKNIPELLGIVNSSEDEDVYSPSYKDNKYSELSLDNSSIEGFIYCDSDTSIRTVLPSNTIFIINNIIFYETQTIKINKGQYMPIRIISSEDTTVRMYHNGIKFFRPILKESNV